MEDYVGEWVYLVRDIKIRLFRRKNKNFLQVYPKGEAMINIPCTILEALREQEWEADSLARSARVKKLISELEPLDV